MKEPDQLFLLFLLYLKYNMSQNPNTILYSEVLGLPRMSAMPRVMCVFFDQHNNVLLSPNENVIKPEYLISEDPFSFAGRAANLMHPYSTILQIVPIALSPDNQVVVLIRLLASHSSHYVEEQENDELMTEAYSLCRQRLESKRHEIPLQEIEASNNIGWRLFAHRNFIKPLYYLFSNLIIKREVLKYAAALSLDERSLICDVGCGYDELAINIAKQYHSTALLNDPVSKPMILAARRKTYSKAIFMNENALELKLARQADMLICKNILHHMDNFKDTTELFKKISKQSNAIVIIDPEKPETTIFGRFWNAYYRNFLLDQGEQFLDFESFKSQVTEYFPGARISIKKIGTIKGNFMAAFISRI